MADLIWGWAFAWLAWRLVLEWRVANQWLPDTDDVLQEHGGGRHPPPNAFTPEGERLWRLRWHVTVWGGLAWCALVGFAAFRTLAH